MNVYKKSGDSFLKGTVIQEHPKFLLVQFQRTDKTNTYKECVREDEIHDFATYNPEQFNDVRKFFNYAEEQQQEPENN